jgi:hypothetical protein
MKNWIREHIDKKRFIRFLVFSVLSLVAYQGFLHVKVFLPTHRYIRQGAAIVTAIMLGLALFYFWTMFKGGLLKTVVTPVGKAVNRIYQSLAKRVSKVWEKIRKALGFPDPSQRLKGRDERSFIFGKKRRDKGTKGQKLEWKDLKDNRERLRFLYVRFIKRQKRKGYHYAVARTPLENGASWRIPKEEGGAFFAAYTDARFADESLVITDDELESYAGLVGKK